MTQISSEILDYICPEKHILKYVSVRKSAGKAYRKGNLVYLPKYVNAEMLTLEFFEGAPVVMFPIKNANPDYGKVRFPHVSKSHLTNLCKYINSNI